MREPPPPPQPTTATAVHHRNRRAGATSTFSVAARCSTAPATSGGTRAGGARRRCSGTLCCRRRSARSGCWCSWGWTGFCRVSLVWAGVRPLIGWKQWKQLGRNAQRTQDSPSNRNRPPPLPPPCCSGEEAVTWESFVSVCWRLVPYYLNQWEAKWGAETSSMVRPARGGGEVEGGRRAACSTAAAYVTRSNLCTIQPPPSPARSTDV